MRRFNYKAKDRKTGKMVTGSIQAINEQAAGQLLIEQGYLPKTVKEEEEGLFGDGKVTTKERIAFTRQFATLVSAGLPLSTSLHLIAEQSTVKATRKMVEEITAQVEAGRTLHDAFAEFPDVFNKVYLSLVAAGEASGSLDVSLRRLADQQEKDESMISKIRGALTYPAIVLLVIIAVVVFMMVQVVPQVENLYDDLGEPLPDLTRMMVNLSNFIINDWTITLFAIVAVVVILMQFKKTETGTKLWAKFKLKVPLFSGLFLRLYNARFARTLQMLLSAGVPMLDSLKLAGEAVNNVEVEQQIMLAANKVKSGKTLSSALKDRKYILPLVPQMAASGEQSGRLDELLGRAAAVYEQELDERIAAISTLIEPILMVVLAVVAGGIVAAILFPIYSLVGKIGSG